MPHKAADRIRNVALIGHRGSGKTSLHEALLFEAEVINRMGRVEDGSIGSEHEVRGVIDLIDMKAFVAQGEDRGAADEQEIPEELGAQAQEYREKLMDEVAESSDELMERYLEGEEIDHDEIVTVLKRGVTDGRVFPVTCGIATKNLGTSRLLAALVEDLPSPAMRGAVRALGEDGEEIEISPDEDGELVAYVFKTLADPYAGRLNLFRVFSGVVKGDSQVTNVTRRARERVGQLLVSQGKEHEQVDELGAGDIGAVAKLKETRAGDALAARDARISFPPLDLPAPVMAFAFEPKTKGDEEKAAGAIRRLVEEDPTLDVHRDQQTGEQIIAGLTQVHVEVIVDRMKERFGAEINLHPPRVPYLESIRKPAKAHGRYKKQTGGRGQVRDCHIELEPAEPGAGLDFPDEIKGGVIPKGFIPAVEKGIAEAMQQGTLAGYPVKDVRVHLVDGSHHSVDSSEMAFKIAGSMAFKQAMEQADPVLLEPIMLLTVTVPEDVVGDVVGDLNSRRGRPLGMEAKGTATEIKAEVPMAEVLDYARDLRQITGGRGEYTMEFARHEEIPSHLAQKVISEARPEEEVRA